MKQDKLISHDALVYEYSQWTIQTNAIWNLINNCEPVEAIEINWLEKWIDNNVPDDQRKLFDKMLEDMKGVVNV